jgi:pimeloyl-ACP methyl ester carboxylesterase
MTAPSTNPAPLLDELQALGAPAWYLDAVGAPQGSRFVPADDGTPLHLVEWNAGEHAKPALLLLHGYRANTHAWDAIAPFLTSRYRVSALDWPGMGCSGHRRAYGDAYAAAADLPAAMDALGGGPVTVVAHSFGGSAAVHAAHRWPQRFARLVVVDSYIPVPGIDTPPQGQAVGPRRVYASRGEILQRFRLMPAQPCPPWALHHMAHHSVREGPEGWVWRFDPALPARVLGYETWQAWQTLQTPVDLIICALSLVAQARDRLQALAAARGRTTNWLEVPGAYHHAMMDQPQALREALLGLLESPAMQAAGATN